MSDANRKAEKQRVKQKEQDEIDAKREAQLMKMDVKKMTESQKKNRQSFIDKKAAKKQE